MSNKQTYGPHLFGDAIEEDTKILLSLTKLRNSEKAEFSSGQASYADLLYAHYTPCGHLFTLLKPSINAVAKQKDKVNLLKTEPRVIALKQCLKKYEGFYTKRQEEIDAWLREQTSRKL